MSLLTILSFEDSGQKLSQMCFVNISLPFLVSHVPISSRSQTTLGKRREVSREICQDERRILER